MKTFPIQRNALLKIDPFGKGAFCLNAHKPALSRPATRSGIAGPINPPPPNPPLALQPLRLINY